MKHIILKLASVAGCALMAVSCLDFSPEKQLSDAQVWDRADNFTLFADEFYEWTRDFRGSTSATYMNGVWDGPHADTRSDLLCEASVNNFSAGNNAATLKGTSSVLFLTEAQTRRNPETNCIRCGKCAEACPMGLEPFLLNKLARNGMMDELEQNAVQDCIECGCCLYSCPANIPLLDIIRVAKGDVIRIIRSRTAPKK